ncbi:MAG: 6,7-dimethyl-8-ribityllumazine synthase [Prevotellaceae bacterium]|jgi:6,7-dimethyl-8-ribityllumazine synthase|nr:6,7-dimethyl-8-ribityllumazine synthase [Prevotellaceae bacterium]
MATALHNLSESANAVPSGKGKKIAIAVSRWNSEITDALLQGAVDELKKNAVLEQDITVETVPGCFELAFAANYLIKRKNPSAVICLGCVIRGETPHFDYVCQAATQGILQTGLQTEIPVIFGVLTVDTLQQAQDRAGGKYGNKGVEAAIAALEMTKFI